MFSVWKYLKQIEKYREQYERPPRTMTRLHQILILHPFKGIKYYSWVLLTFLPSPLLYHCLACFYSLICVSINSKYSYLYDIKCYHLAYTYCVVAKNWGSIPGLGRTPGEGNSKLLQYSCLENSMDGGTWWATVCGVAKSQTRLRNSHFHCFHIFPPIVSLSARFLSSNLEMTPKEITDHELLHLFIIK